MQYIQSHTFYDSIYMKYPEKENLDTKVEITFWHRKWNQGRRGEEKLLLDGIVVLFGNNGNTKI